jgi:hypothetical protein
MFQRCALPQSSRSRRSQVQKECWLYRNWLVEVKLEQTSGERGDDKARKRANGRGGGAFILVAMRTWDLTCSIVLAARSLSSNTWQEMPDWKFCGNEVLISYSEVLMGAQVRNELNSLSMMFRAVFWVILQCKMIADRRFRGAYCLHHPWSLKRRSTIILHGSITQKTALNIILAAVRTWNLTQN